MRVVVDRDLCEATGVCTGLAPEVFESDEEGMPRVLVQDLTGRLRAAVEQAVRNCPVAALSIQTAD